MQTPEKKRKYGLRTEICSKFSFCFLNWHRRAYLKRLLVEGRKSVYCHFKQDTDFPRDDSSCNQALASFVGVLKFGVFWSQCTDVKVHRGKEGYQPAREQLLDYLYVNLYVNKPWLKVTQIRTMANSFLEKLICFVCICLLVFIIFLIYSHEIFAIEGDKGKGKRQRSGSV